MSNHDKLMDLFNRINRGIENGRFDKNILYIRFPFYKNILENTRIDFKFPLTVFIGPNGSGKSSTLHALYGAPDGYSTGNYWFSTHIDPIEEGEGNPNCFIYAYKSKDAILEVLKTRIKRENPDYWEPSRPLKKYGMLLMEGKRNPAIKKDVVYIDFRSELSAFDKYFYFASFKSSKRIKTKQDVIRKYSSLLKTAIDENKVVQYRTRKNQKPDVLNPAAIKHISKILSKEYSYCTLITHSFFSNEGLSVYFKTTGINYSEAFAGRGEFAVVKIVTEVLNAEDDSLIILDEPEVSLHPGAQEELKIFLLEQILIKRLQIIISTHSPKFSEFLPDDAIKLFYQTTSGKFEVKNSCNYIEAFYAVGIDVKDEEKNIIIVEDITAKLLIESIMKEMGAEFPLLFKVGFYAGGASGILKKAVSYSEENEVHKFLLLDGDQKKPISDPQNFTAAELMSLDFIKQKIFEISNISFEKIGFRLNSNSSDEDKVKSGLKYLKFLKTNLNFLPGSYPESFLWNHNLSKRTLGPLHKRFKSSQNAKQNFLLFSELLFGDREQNSYIGSLKIFITEFIRKKDDRYKSIETTLQNFKMQVQKNEGH